MEKYFTMISLILSQLINPMSKLVQKSDIEIHFSVYKTANFLIIFMFTSYYSLKIIFIILLNINKIWILVGI